MSGGSFAEALGADADHVVCFRPGGVEYRWSDFLGHAASVQHALAGSQGQRWALDLDDSYEFAYALMGCWAAGKTAVVAPPQMLNGDEDVVVDGVLRTDGESGGERPVLRLADLPGACGALGAVPKSSRFVLYTSGTTGRPKEVVRCLRNAEAEIGAFESLWGASLPGASVHSSVSHRHVYGLLFAVLWPLLSRRAFAAATIRYPEQVLGPVAQGNVFVSSPALLKRIGHLDACAAPWGAAFSSGGLLPRAAAAEAARVLGGCPIEVFGSTETSGVAWRRQQGADPERWTPLPDVNVRLAEDGSLEVASPYSGVSEWLRMGDRVRMPEDGTFELLGRGDRIAKIEDKRVSLTQIEDSLLESPHVQDVAAIALADDARQFVAVAVQLNETGCAELGRVGRQAFGAALKSALRSKVDPIGLPRKIRYVEQLPIDSQGKRTHTEIARLFEGS